MAEPNLVDQIFGVNWLGIPVVLWLLGAVFIIGFILKRKPKEEKFKRKILEKETKPDIKFLFSFAKHKINKPLSDGQRKFKFVLSSVNCWWDYAENMETNIQRNINMAQNEDVKNAVLKNHTNLVRLYGLRTCENNIIARLIAIIGIGVKPLLVNEKLLTFLEPTVVINPLAQPTEFIGVVIYDQAAKNWLIQNVVYKHVRTSELEEEINFIGKQTFLEVENSKNKEQLDVLDQVNKEKRKEQLEQIKKA